MFTKTSKTLKAISAVLCLMFVFLSLAVGAPQAALADSVPFNDTHYVLFYATSGASVYCCPTLTAANIGSSSPFRRYSAACIDKNDYCRLLEIRGSSARVRYPVGNKTQEAWWPLNKIFPCGTRIRRIVSKSTETSYRMPNLSSTFGSISKNDVAYDCGQYNSNAYAIAYPIDSTSYYKLGFFSKAQYQRITGTGGSESTASNPKAAKVQKIINYARNHWNDGKGLCAEFVSDCIKQAGINVPNNPSYYPSSKKTLAGNRLNGYNNPYTCSEALLLWFSEKGYRIIRNPQKKDVNLGDVAFMKSGVSDGHVVVITGKDSSGNYTYSAHNNNRLKQRVEFSGTWKLTFLVKINNSDAGITPIQ